MFFQKKNNINCMEEISKIQDSTNCPRSFQNRLCETFNQTDVKRPIIQAQSLSQTIADSGPQKKFKSILLHKRQASNTINLTAQIYQNASTDNEDGTQNIVSKAFGRRIAISYILADLKVLQNFFPYQVNFRLLYRASDHHFSVEKFHQLCDLQSNTIVICKTKQNQIIGGYTPLTWVEDYQDNQTYFKTDKLNQTFLFSVTKNQKYQLAKAQKNKAICCFKGFGPTFGGGYDLQIGDKGDTSYQSISYFPRSYNCSQKSANNKYLTGSKNRQFKVLEWQVYKVIKQERKQLSNLTKQQEGLSILQTIKNGLMDLFFSKNG